MIIKEIKEIYDKYEKSFEECVLHDNEYELFKVLVAPMRFGKTRLAITHNIPFLLEKTNVNCIVLTSPLGSILKQKERKLKNTISRLNGVELCNDPVEAQEALDDGQKVVLVMTNMAAWVGTKSEELFNKIDKTKTAFIIDEAHYWTTDCAENYPNVVGGGATKSDNPKRFKGVLYNRVKTFSIHTPHIYGLTATTNKQHKGDVPALDFMQFKVINLDFIEDGEIVKKLSYRLGWFDSSRFRFMDFGIWSKTDLQFQEMLSVHMKRELAIKQKITGFIEAKRKESNAEENSNLYEIKDLFKNSKFESDDLNEDSAFYVIMTSEEIQLYTKNGMPLEKITEKEVYSYLNDQTHPLRYLVVVDMAKMGVDLQTTKLFFSFRETEKKTKDFEKFGYILESTIQKYGRLLTPNSGVSEKIFFDKYDGIFGNVPNFHPEMNMMDFWVMDNQMNIMAMELFGEKFAPEMPDMKSYLEECCGECGALKKHWRKKSEIENNDYDKLDEVLSV